MGRLLARGARLNALALMTMAVVAACMPPPSPAPSRTPPQPSASRTTTARESQAAYDLAPPREIQDWLAANLGLTFRPLTPSELVSVRLTLADAQREALADSGPGYGPGDSHIVWERTGCIYLGYYIGPMEPSLGYIPPEFIAYLVQQIGEPVADFPGMNVGIVPVNAITGTMGTRYGSGPGPILGTTCGVAP